MKQKNLYDDAGKFAYENGWRMGFYWGMFLMGLFGIFVFVMIFVFGGFK